MPTREGGFKKGQFLGVRTLWMASNLKTLSSPPSMLRTLWICQVELDSFLIHSSLNMKCREMKKKRDSQKENGFTSPISQDDMDNLQGKKWQII